MICARMCMIVIMVVVYGIARTTIISSVIEAVFSISCMNHVGLVHLKEGEREKKPSIKNTKQLFFLTLSLNIL